MLTNKMGQREGFRYSDTVSPFSLFPLSILEFRHQQILRVKFSQLLVSVKKKKKALLEQSSPYSFTDCLWLFLYYMAELDSVPEEVQLKKPATFTLWPFTKNLCHLLSW